MPASLMTITPNIGKPFEVPFMQFVLNPGMQFCALGIDFDLYPEIKLGVEQKNIEVEYAGKLSKQLSVPMNKIQVLLFQHGWDYEQFPNPEIILITDKSSK